MAEYGQRLVTNFENPGVGHPEKGGDLRELHVFMIVHRQNLLLQLRELRYAPSQERKCLIEVEVGQGCIAIPLSKYATFNTRICRPIGLSDEECRKVITFMIDRIGLQYDMRNIIDLLRYLLPTPPVPTRWRRRMIALGSGEPTRAICSTLIAQAFQSIR